VSRFKSVWRMAHKGKNWKGGRGKEPNGFYMFCPTVQWCLKRSHTVSRSCVCGRAGRTQLFSLWQTAFSTFSSPWWLSFWRSFVPEPQRCLENAGSVLVRASSPQMLFEVEYPFILKAFTYLEIDAKATDDFQINITISW